jgi:large subunit ribosomal protein L4
MAIPVLREDGVTHGEGTLAPALAAQEVKPHLIHETVVAEMAARRRGTHATRNRSAVRGGGAKPWRQKGTGRARQGSIRAPQWTGGGVVFGPVPRDHSKKVNRKVRAQAFRAALRAHADRGSLAVMDPTGWDAPSTKRAAAYLFQAPEGVAAVRPLLVVVEDRYGVDACSFRNLEGVYVLEVGELETVDLMAARAMLVSRAAWERLSGAEVEVTPVTPSPKPVPERKPAPKKRRAAAGPPPEEPAEEPAAEAAEEPAAAEPEAPEAEEDGPAAQAEEAPEASEEPAEEAEAPEAEEPEADEEPEASEEDPEDAEEGGEEADAKPS